MSELRPTNWLRIGLLMVLVAGLPLIAPSTAQAQGRATDPNMGHFYMARQQITITDDAPLVNNKTTQPGMPGAAGALPAGVPQGLPPARWTQYSPVENPNLSTSLPKVQNGVPPKMPPAGPKGLKGKTGKLTGKPAGAAKVAAKAPAQPSTQAYAPYKKFTPDGIVGGESNTNSNVKGDVLHWARRGH